VEKVDLEESFLTVAEVAQVLKLNQQTVRNWIDQGSLPALRVGRRVRIRRSDFDRLLAEGLDGSSGGAAAATVATRPTEGPSAEDFWGGEPVGLAEPAPGQRSAEHAMDGDPAPASQPSAGHSTPQQPSAGHSTHGGGGG
jgi:excisionase family DNA binding protein